MENKKLNNIGRYFKESESFTDASLSDDWVNVSHCENCNADLLALGCSEMDDVHVREFTHTSRIYCSDKCADNHKLNFVVNVLIEVDGREVTQSFYVENETHLNALKFAILTIARESSELHWSNESSVTDNCNGERLTASAEIVTSKELSLAKAFITQANMGE